MLPANEWFLGLDADGMPMSSDFYLRLTRDGAKMLKGQTSLQWKMPTRFRDEVFATSFEAPKDVPASASEGKNTTLDICEPTTERPQRHEKSLEYRGRASGENETMARRKLSDFADATRAIRPNVILYYSFYPENENGRFAAIDFHFTDGTTLAQSAFVDQNGRPLAASAGHSNAKGAVAVNAWTTIASDLGAVAGKKIESMWFVFDRSGATGEFSGYIDDLRICN